MLFFSTQNPSAIHYKRQKTAARNWNLLCNGIWLHTHHAVRTLI
ncbi:hypothetical protein AVDCRST_MAG84-443 [uncultured Microcoleus sp.]|uniref:Uncharacterized protein n=1 Tax=uncultured Microcoleus sp. TaxID=259945 RepID=A0A6J4KHR5_9CYAN|nr:hypothetical protein AVDCRST_MAG84-443 [uncultured Microcoleus sp.]